MTSTSTTSTLAASTGAGGTSRKRERWLVTRKTWQYMADAGKLLIPEALRKGKDTRDYSSDDFKQLDEHYQQVCNNLQEFVLWEGPALDPRITIAKNRLTSGIGLLVQSLGSLHQERLDTEQASIRSSSECESPPIEAAKTTGAKKKKKNKAKSKSKSNNSGNTTTSMPMAPIAAIRRASFTAACPASPQHPKPAGTFIQGAHQTQVGPQTKGNVQTHGNLDRVRVMLPAGEKPPEGYVEVGRRVLPMGAIGPTPEPPSEESLIHLPSGMILQELPAVYANAEDREWYNSRRSSSTTTKTGPESSVTSPVTSIPPEDFTTDMASGRPDLTAAMSGPMSAAMSAPMPGVLATQTMSPALSERTFLKTRRGAKSVLTQTEPLPPEFEQLMLEEQRRREEEELKLALEAEEKILRDKQMLEAAHMGDQVMRYLHLVRRNSKSSDQKKADRFRSMNYDPTLRNIKSKYLMKESLLEGTKHMEIQIGESLITILKRCHTPIDPTPDREQKRKWRTRPMSMEREEVKRGNVANSTIVASGNAALWESSESIQKTMSPARKRTAAFVRRLHASDMPLEDEYFSYMNAWYDAQRGVRDNIEPLQSVPNAPTTTTTPTTPTPTRPTPAPTTPTPTTRLGGLTMGKSTGGVQHTGIYIPVSVLQNLRNSLPIVVASNADESGNVVVTASDKTVVSSKRSIKKSTGSSSSRLLQSVMASKPFTATASVSAAKKLPKLWRAASSGGGGGGTAVKAAVNVLNSNCSNNTALWTPKESCRWQHTLTTREIVLDSSHVMLTSEAERVPLRKLAVDKLNQTKLMGPNTSIRIPKEPSESAPKSRRRGLLGRRKTGGAGIAHKKIDKEGKRTSLTSGSSSGALSSPHALPMFGVPLHLCLDQSLSPLVTRKRSSVHSMMNTSDDSLLLSPPPPLASLRRRGRSSESRSSFDSIHSAVAGKTLLTPDSRISSPPYSLGSTESLASVFFDSASRSNARRRSSVAGAASSSSGVNLDSVSCHSYLERAAAGNEEDLASAVGQVAPGLHVPPIVVMCIRHLEQQGLRTVGIFRVSASKKRVRQLRDDLDAGLISTIPEDANVHDVAALLKEFLRDLPEPLFPKELLAPLLATQKLSEVEQTWCLQRLMQLLAPAHRDTLFVLLHFLALVTEHSEDKTLADNTVVEAGNKMDATNLATLFAPNVFHALTDACAGDEEQRSLQVAAMRTLIEKREQIFEINAHDLHDVYVYLHDHFPALLDALLNKRLVAADASSANLNALLPDEEDELLENTEESSTLLPTSIGATTTTPPSSSLLVPKESSLVCGTVGPQDSLVYSSPPTEKPVTVFFDSSSSQASSVFGSPTSVVSASQTTLNLMSENCTVMDEEFGSSSTLVLQPAPSKRSSEKLNKAWRTAPHSVGLADRRAAGAFRSKTDDLERLLSDVHDTNNDDDTNDDLNNDGRTTGNRGVRRYARRRYTDTRHPTTELADLSDTKK